MLRNLSPAARRPHCIVVCVGCCGVFAFVGLDELDKEELQVKAQIADHPVIVQHIGQIVSIERDWSQSIDEDDMNIWFFRLVGTVDEGDLVIKEQGGLSFENTEFQIAGEIAARIWRRARHLAVKSLVLPHAAAAAPCRLFLGAIA